MKRYERLHGIWMGVILCLLGVTLRAAPSTESYPYNATGELLWKTDSMTLTYRLELHGHRPAEGDIVGQMQVFGERNPRQPLADFSIKRLSDPDMGKDEMQVAFMIPGPPGEAASFFRRARLVYDQANGMFRFYPVYRSTPKPLDAYLEFPVDMFSLKANLRPVSDEDLAGLQAAADSAVAASTPQVEPRDTAGFGAYLGDGTWHGNLRARDKMYKSAGFQTFWWVLVVIWVAFLAWMLPKAWKARRVLFLLLAAFCCLMVNFDGIYPFWVVMPGFMIAYPKLYSRVYSYSFLKVVRLFTWCGLGMLVILWVVFYHLWGWNSIRELVYWVVAGALAWVALVSHLRRSCCRQCGAYGRHRKLSEKLVKREVIRSRIHDDTYDHTEVRSDEIIDWYKRKYGVRIEIVETFDVFYECRSCGQIFKNQIDRFKSKEKW